MKPTFFFFSALLLLSFAASPPVKYFEGEVDYDVSYESHRAGTDARQLALMFGVKEQFFISGARYKSLTDGQLVEMQLYDPVGNRIYTKVPESDTLVYFNAADNRDTIADFSFQPAADTILGQVCRALSFKTTSGSSTYYFNDRYPLNAAAFRAHHFANWAFFCEKAGAVPLKMVISTADWTMTAVATEIRPIRLDSTFFLVPAGKQVPGRN